MGAPGNSFYYDPSVGFSGSKEVFIMFWEDGYMIVVSWRSKCDERWQVAVKVPLMRVHLSLFALGPIYRSSLTLY